MAHLHHPRSRASTRQSSVVRLVVLVVLLGGAVSSVTAQQRGSGDAGDPDDPDGPEGTEWGLGIGVLAKQDAYRGIKRENEVVPWLRFENEYLEFNGLELEVRLPSLQLGERSQIKFGLGLEAEWHLGEHAMLVPYVAAYWLDKKYVDYYYGVRAAEATVGRAAYVGKGGVNVDIGLRTMYQFDEHHSMLLDVSITRLSKQIKASPLVGRSSTNQVILGYMYSF